MQPKLITEPIERAQRQRDYAAAERDKVQAQIHALERQWHEWHNAFCYWSAQVGALESPNEYPDVRIDKRLLEPQ